MGEMRFWHQFTEHLGGAAGIDEIAHHQPAAAIANNRGRLDDCGLVCESLGIPVQILPSSRKLSRGWGWWSWTFQLGCSEAMSIQVVAVAIFRATVFASRRRVDELRQLRPEPLLCIGR
jgi:hypothetical protein